MTYKQNIFLKNHMSTLWGKIEKKSVQFNLNTNKVEPGTLRSASKLSPFQHWLTEICVKDLHADICRTKVY